MIFGRRMTIAFTIVRKLSLVPLPEPCRSASTDRNFNASVACCGDVKIGGKNAD